MLTRRRRDELDFSRGRKPQRSRRNLIARIKNALIHYTPRDDMV